MRCCAVGGASRVLVGGRPRVDVAAKRVRVHDKPVDLTPREWALLELFLARPNRVLSKDQIAESLFAHRGEAVAERDRSLRVPAADEDRTGRRAYQDGSRIRLHVGGRR